MMFRHLNNVSGWGETTPLGPHQFLERANGSARSVTLECKWTIPESYLLWLGHTTQEAIALFLNHPVWHQA